MHCIILILLNFFHYVQGTIPIFSDVSQRGCQVVDTNTPCINECPQGQADCLSNELVCEYGYFLYNLNGIKDCVKCPFQDYQEELIMYCMDCVENPNTWNLNRTCTYNYIISNGNITTGVYIKKQIPSPSAFYVINSNIQTTIPGQRQLPKKEVQLCDGCKQFCLDQTQSDQCQLSLDNYQEFGQMFIICKDGYYYYDAMCQSCGDNCKQCDYDDDIGEYYCLSCNPLFALDPRNFTCVTCFENCIDCYFGDEYYTDYSSEYGVSIYEEYGSPPLKMFCNFCGRSDYGEFLISALDQLSCVLCDEGCERCEYVSYDEELISYGDLYQYPTRNNFSDEFVSNPKLKDKYVKRCRQCIEYYDYTTFITFDGQKCGFCSDYNCAQCYQSLGDNKFTYDLDFTPITSSDYIWDECYQCQDGYQLDQYGECQQIDNTQIEQKIENCVRYKYQTDQFLCQKCKDTYLLDLSLTIPDCSQICTSFLDRCISCYRYLDGSKIIYVCIKCISGYYPDFFTGICQPCNSNLLDSSCQTCPQYSESYNLDDYLQITPQLNSFQKQKLQYDGGILYNGYCNLCSDGFYYNYESLTCGRCGPDCGSCDYSNFQCNSCSNSNQKSLTSDLRECLQCPNNCLACRDRTQQELYSINPSFYPVIQDYWKYSRLCYLTQSGFYYDTQLGLPVDCSSTTTGICKKTINLDILIYCNVDDYNRLPLGFDKSTNYSLNAFFSQSDNQIVSIKFDKLEVPENYEIWNKEVISEMNLTINFKGDLCVFKKPTKLDIRIQQNVFSLKKLRVILNGISDSQVSMQMKGQLYISNIIDVTLKNVIFSYFQSSKQRKSPVYYGLSLINNGLTSLSFENVIFGNEYPNPNLYEILTCTWKNVYQLSMVNVKFNQNYYNKSFSTVPFSMNFDVNYTSTVRYYFDNVQIYGFNLSNNNLFSLNKVQADAQYLIIGPNGFIIDSCSFFNSQVFGENTTKQSNPNTNISIEKFIVMETNFVQSSLIDFVQARNVYISNFDMYQIQLINNSQAIMLNQFQELSNIFCYQLSITNQSSFIKSYYFENPVITEWNINNINFNYTNCSTQQCLIILKNLNQPNLKMSNLSISSTDTSDIAEIDISSVQSALVYISSMNDVSISGFSSYNNLAIVVLNVNNVFSLDMQNIFISQLSNTQDNRIPATEECAKLQISLRLYNMMHIFVQYSKKGVQFKNLEIKDLLMIDNSPIYIESYNPLVLNTSNVQGIDQSKFYCNVQQESINCINCNFLRNKLVVTDPNNQVSLFFIVSNQLQMINLINNFFKDNFFHQFISQTVVSCTCLLIDSVDSIVTIQSTQLIQNVATNSSKGLVYIKADQIIYNNTECFDANIYDDQRFYNIFGQNLKEQNFMFQSEGTCGYFISFNVSIYNSLFQQIQGTNGAGIYIQLSGLGLLKIINSNFLDISGSLLQTDHSMGGCLYVDSQSSALNMYLEGVEMLSCKARLQGGCIHVEPSIQFTNITITNSDFYYCFALQYSFMDVKFSDLSKVQSQVTLNQSTISSDYYLYTQFLYSIQNIQTNEQEYFTDSVSVFYQRNGQFTLLNTQFIGIFYTSLIELQNMNSIIITSLSISDVILFTRPLLNLELNSQSQNSYFLSGIQIVDITEFTAIINEDDQQICDQLSLPAIKIPIDYNQCDGQILQDEVQALYLDFSQSSNLDYYSLSDSDKYDFKQKSENPTFVIPQLQYLTGNQYYPGNMSNEDAYSYNTQCMLTFILNQKLNSNEYLINQDLFTSLITIQSVEMMQRIQIKALSIMMNYCNRCSGGLIQIRSVNSIGNINRITIQDFICQNNTVGYWGCLTITTESVIGKIDVGFNLTEQYNFVESSQRILQQDEILDELNKDKYSVKILNSYFFNNNAKVGTGLCIIGLKSFVYKTQFILNKAIYAVGGLYFKNTKDYKNNSTDKNQGQDVTITIYETDFSSNQAQLYGAAYFYDQSMNKEQEMKINFYSNQADIFSPNLQEYATRLSIQIIDGQETLPLNRIYSCEDSNGFIPHNCTKIVDQIVIKPYYVNNFINDSAPQVNKTLAHYFMMPSGQAISSYNFYNAQTKEQIPYRYIFRVVNLDRFNQKIGAQVTDQCKVQGRIRYQDSSNNSIPFSTANILQQNIFPYNTQEVAYDLDALMIQFDPKTSKDQFLQLQFKCSSVQIPIYNNETPYDIESYFTGYELWLNIQTFDCQVGEYYSQGKCIACMDGSDTYSLSADYIECKVIDQKSMISATNVQIELHAGYWRPYDDIDSVSYCLNLAANCKGGWETGDDSCYIGHIGALCEQCDIKGARYGESWATSGKSTCGKCANIMSSNVIIIVAISMFTLISMIFSVKSTREIVELQLKNKTRISIGSLVKENKNNVAILIKILTNYFQIISAITAFQVSLPGQTKEGLETLGQPTKSMAVSYDCLFIQIAPMIPTLYFRMIWALIIPFCYLIIYLLGYAIAILFKITSYRSIVIYTTFIYMFIYLQPTVIGGFIAIASSRRISGFEWVQADVSIRSDSPTHIIWSYLFALPNILLWGLIFPCSWLYSLYKKRNSLDTKQTRNQLGFFYNEYRLVVYYWEFIKIFQKELLTIFLIYYDDYVPIKGLLIFIIIWGYGFLTLKEKPYQNQLLNDLDFQSASVCALTMCLGVIVNVSTSYDINYLFYICLLIIAITNLWFLLQIIKVLIIGYYDQFQDQLDIVRTKLLEKKPQLQSQYPWMKPYLKIHKLVDERNKYLWAQFRYQIRQSIKRRRKDPTQPILTNMIQPQIDKSLSFEKNQNEKNITNTEINQSDVSKMQDQYEQDKLIVQQKPYVKSGSNASQKNQIFPIIEEDENQQLKQK